MREKVDWSEGRHCVCRVISICWRRILVANINGRMVLVLVLSGSPHSSTLLPRSASQG